MHTVTKTFLWITALGSLIVALLSGFIALAALGYAQQIEERQEIIADHVEQHCEEIREGKSRLML